MESDIERVYRKSFPSLWPRFALWVLIAYAVNYCHAVLRPRVVHYLPSRDLLDLYLRTTSTIILTATFSGLGFLVVCYYYSLRDRRVHTALSEAGLAVRAVFAGLLALAAFVVAIHINAGGGLAPP